MANQFDPEKVERHMFGCCSYEDTWRPDIGEDWGTPEKAYQYSFVSTEDYDLLLELYRKSQSALEDHMH